MDLAGKVRSKRIELGWSQDELAKRMGYSSRSSINKIENGRPVSQKIIKRLSECLGVSIAYLMGWDADPDETSKKIDATTDIIIRMERDSDFSDLVQKLYTLDNEKIKGVKAMLDSFFQ